MTDYISRQAAIDEYARNVNGYRFMDEEFT